MADPERSETTPATPSGPSRGRAIGAWTLIVVAAILSVLTIFAVWVNRVALNTDVYVETSTQLIENPAIRSAVATNAVDEIFSRVDVEAEVKDQLPTDFKSLAGPATAALQQASYRIVDDALERPVFQRLWITANREMHETLVQTLEGGGPRVSTEGGAVVLDLGAIAREAVDQIGIGQDLVAKLPEDIGRIEILRSDQLGAAQDGAQILKTLAWILPLLTLLAFAGAIWLMRGRRLRAVLGTGAALVLVGCVGLVATTLIGNYLVDALVLDENTKTAASDAWDIVTELLRGAFRSAILIGVLLMAASWLGGKSRRATATRGFLAPYLQERVVAYIALGVLLLLWFVTRPVSDFASALVLLTLLSLGIAGVELLRRETLAEFPDAVRPTYFDGTRGKVSDWFEDRRTQKSAASTAPSAGSITSELEHLNRLHEQGALTDSEFASAKAQLLSNS